MNDQKARQLARVIGQILELSGATLSEAATVLASGLLSTLVQARHAATEDDGNDDQVVSEMRRLAGNLVTIADTPLDIVEEVATERAAEEHTRAKAEYSARTTSMKES